VKNISVVVVNWNTPDLTRTCVDHLRRHTRMPYELILVDNGSSDDSPAVLKELADERTRLVLLPANTGFAAGNNRGIEQARGDGVCLLNSDTRVTRGWLESMVRKAQSREAGLVGPCTNRAKGPQRHKLWLGRFKPLWMPTQEVIYLSFFCVLIDRAVLDRVGLLDERFGLGGCEDDDYCLRAREAGFRLWIDGGAWVWHDASRTFDANRVDQDAIQQRNLELFHAKWGSRAQSHKIQPRTPRGT
jgi:GT2 family glycosyltransferase